MKIHHEGYTIILVSFLLLLALNLGLMYLIPKKWILIILGLASLIFFILIVRFFRNPDRNTPINENYIIAPCDGKVVIIEEAEEPEYFKDKRLQISIFMSPLNVHVNRNPISGIVKFFKYHPGKYLVAWHPKSSTLNERTTVVVENSNGIILYRQIAGAVARRIRTYVDEGNEVKQGEEFGFIKFGSRVDVFLPLGTKVNVSLEQIVVGGETVLAEF